MHANSLPDRWYSLNLFAAELKALPQPGSFFPAWCRTIAPLIRLYMSFAAVCAAFDGDTEARQESRRDSWQYTYVVRCQTPAGQYDRRSGTRKKLPKHRRERVGGRSEPRSIVSAFPALLRNAVGNEIELLAMAHVET